jgi:hypothetical protein
MPSAAVAIRIRYLLEQMDEWHAYVNGEQDNVPYADVQTIAKELELLQAPDRPMHGHEVTDAMIEQARMVPVADLIDFTRGKAICFNHDDQSPSMYNGTRIGKAVCPVCNKAFDTIAIKMIRDGLSFHEAVRHLCRGDR